MGDTARDEPVHHCVYCRRLVFEARDGAWYHRHNASISCKPGWGSRTASPIVITSGR